MTGFKAIALLVGLTSLASSLAAQTDIPATVTHTYPFSSCDLAVGEGNRIYMGSGGGVFVLNASDDLDPDLDGAAGQNRIRSGGFTRDIALTQQLVQVAAGKQGFTRFKRLDGHLAAGGLAFADVGTCRTIAVEQVGDFDVSFLGTNDADVGGRVHLVTALSNGSNAPVKVATWDADAPVSSLAAYVHNGGDTLTLLVGTWCRTQPAPLTPASLVRFDFDITDDAIPEEFPAPSDTWSRFGSSEFSVEPTLIRDIAIDEQAHVAYVATHTNGVHRVLLTGTGLIDANYGESDWPILAANGNVAHFVGVNVHRPTTGEPLLVVTLGFPFPGDRQEWGGCSIILACDESIDSPRQPDEQGVLLYDVAGDPILIDEMEFAAPPYSAHVRPLIPASHNSFYIDVATPHGLRIVKAVRGTDPPWSLELKGDFANTDGHKVSSCDDLLTIGNNLYVAAENVLTAFDATLSPTGTQLLDTPLIAPDLSGAVLLTGFQGSGAYPTMLFSSDYAKISFKRVILGAGGFVQAIDQVESPPPGSPTLVLDGRGPGILAVGPGATPDREGAPWLFAILQRANDTTAGCPGAPFNSGIQAWRLPEPAGVAPTPAEAQSLDDWLPRSCPPSGDPIEGTFMDGWTDMTSSSAEFTFFVSYGPRGNEHDAGLLAVTGTLVHGSVPSRDKIQWDFVGKVPAFQDVNPSEASVTRITRSVYDNRLYVALACHGVAVYTYNGVGNVPTLDAAWPSDGRSAMQARHIVQGGSSRVYVTFIDGEVGVFDTNLVEKGHIRVPGQPNAIHQVTSLSGNPAFLLAGGAGGVQRIELNQSPP